MLCVATAKDEPYKNMFLFTGSERSPYSPRKERQRSCGDTSREDTSLQRGGAGLGGSLYGISLDRGRDGRCDVHGGGAHTSPHSTDEPAQKNTAFKRLVQRGLSSGAPRPKGHVFQQPQQPRQKALVIGINGPPGQSQLDYAVNDARRFEKCLRDRLQFNDIRVLTDEKEGDASRTDIMKGLRWLFDDASSTDVLVLFISGHCSLTRENQVVSLHSAGQEHAPILVPSTVFKSHIEGLPQGCTVEVVLDCCYSSGLVNTDHVIEDMARHSVFYGDKRSSSGELEALVVSGKPRVAQLIPAYNVKVGQPYGSYGRTQPVTGPRPDEKLQTSADLTVWAACGSDEKAFESLRPEVKNGVLTHAICSTIERTKGDIALVQRRAIWNSVMLNAQEENQLRFKRGLCEAQHPQVIGSRHPDVMNEYAFRRGRTKTH